MTTTNFTSKHFIVPLHQTALDIYRPVHAKLFLKLKLTCILLLSIVLQVNANSFVQLTLKEQSASLESVLQKIRQLSNHDFFYSTELLYNAKPVSINVKNASIEETLTTVLKDQHLSYIIEQQTIIIKPLTSPKSEDMLVTGKIVNEKDIPMKEATMKIENKKDGPTAISDDNGNFNIIVSKATVLVINYLDYQAPEIDLSDTRLIMPIQIKLKEAVEQLSQVEVNTRIFTKPADRLNPAPVFTVEGKGIVREVRCLSPTIDKKNYQISCNGPS